MVASESGSDMASPAAITSRMVMVCTYTVHLLASVSQACPLSVQDSAQCYDVPCQLLAVPAGEAASPMYDDEYDQYGEFEDEESRDEPEGLPERRQKS